MRDDRLPWVRGRWTAYVLTLAATVLLALAGVVALALGADATPLLTGLLGWLGGALAAGLAALIGGETASGLVGRDK